MEDTKTSNAVHGGRMPMTNSNESLNLDLELKCNDKKKTEAQRLSNIQAMVDHIRVACNAPTED